MSVLVITWNSAAVLGPMLDTLSPAADGLDLELIHIDNASTDASTELVAKRWAGRLVQRINTENLGFARALKQAVEIAEGNSLLMLNPDVRLTPGSVDTLIDRLSSDFGLGAVGPVVRKPTGEVELVCARRTPRLRQSVIEAVGLRPALRGTVLDQYTYPRATYGRERDVPCLSGAAMLVRRSALEAAGGVDDRFFMYFEDVDICVRLREHGFRLRFCPDAEVTHISEASSPRDPSLQTWLSVHSEAAFNFYFATHRGRAAAFAHRCLVGIQGLVRALLGLLPGGRPRREGWTTTGLAKVRWALAGKMPAGGPPAASYAEDSTPSRSASVSRTD